MKKLCENSHKEILSNTSRKDDVSNTTDEKSLRKFFTRNFEEDNFRKVNCLRKKE